VEYFRIIPNPQTQFQCTAHYVHHCIPQELFHISGSVFAERPHKDIHNFVGRFSMGLNPQTTQAVFFFVHSLPHNNLMLHSIIFFFNAKLDDREKAVYTT